MDAEAPTLQMTKVKGFFIKPARAGRFRAGSSEKRFRIDSGPGKATVDDMGGVPDHLPATAEKEIAGAGRQDRGQVVGDFAGKGPANTME